MVKTSESFSEVLSSVSGLQASPAMSPVSVSDRARTISLFAATLALGLISGFFYTYEVSVMRGFARLSDADFISAMQAVNATIRNWAFASSFFGAALLILVAALLHARAWRSWTMAMIAGAGLFYISGALLLTLAINVPLNDWLATQGPAALMIDPGAIRAQYEADWVFWNLIRALNSGLAFLLMCGALRLDARGRSQPMRQALK